MCWLTRLFAVTLFSYCHVRNDNVIRSVFVGFVQDPCLGTGHKVYVKPSIHALKICCETSSSELVHE
jgi:hypothetical protein